jgi:hypothetical protein
MNLEMSRVVVLAGSLMTNISDYASGFNQFIHENITFVPPTVIYLAIVVALLLLVVQAVKVAFRLAVYIVLPTVGSALVVTYAFPGINAAHVLPAAAALFTGIFVFKR